MKTSEGVYNQADQARMSNAASMPNLYNGVEMGRGSLAGKSPMRRMDNLNSIG